jgi:hypothetical protein
VATTTAIAAILGATAAVGGTIASLTKGAPKIPGAPAPSQSPNVDAFRKKNAGGMAPGAALSGNSSTLLGGSGPSQSVGTSTLLGQ